MLVLGLANTGKTLLVKQLLIQVTKKGDSREEVVLDPVTNPTTGFDTNKLRLRGGKKGGEGDVFLNEVGSAMISTWH